MKFNVNYEFWDKSNFFAKACFVLAAFFADLGMKLMGLKQK